MLFPLTTGIGAAALAAGAYFAPHFLRLAQTRRLRAVCACRRTLVLTYDDGPGPELKPRVLTLLAEFGVRATFFLLGRRVADHPEPVDEVAAAGHEIGCHSQNNRHAWRTVPWRNVRDVDAGYRTLARWVPTSGLYRPPNGKVTLATWYAVRRRRAAVAWWTVDSGDTHAVLPTAQSVVERVRRDGGGVVLMHDFDRDPASRAARHAHVLDTTAQLLELARVEALPPCTLGRLLRSGVPGGTS